MIQKSIFRTLGICFLSIMLCGFRFSTELMMFVTLRSGTVVSLELNEDIDPDEISRGALLDFIVRSNVIVNGKILIAAGSSGAGRLKNIIGYSDEVELTVTVNTVQAVDGQHVSLRSRPEIIRVKMYPEKTSTLGKKIRARVLNQKKIKP